MVSRFRLLPLAMLALLALLLVACGGGSSDDDSSGDSSQNITDGTDADGGDSVSNDGGNEVEEIDYVTNARAVLAQSADAFATQEVSSVQGDVNFNFTMGTTAVDGTANFVYEAPAGMHMQMTFGGGDSTSLIDLSQLGTLEVLVREEGLFLNFALLGGWVVLSPEEAAAFSGESISNMISRGSMFDYSGFIENADGAAFVGEEDVDGVTTVHYTVTGTLQTLIGSFGDALGATGDNAISGQLLESGLDGPVSVDVWVGKDDSLPYKLNVTANIALPDGTAMVMNLGSSFHDYNEAVTLPPAPPDAIPFAQVMGALGIAPPAAPTQ